MTGGFNKFKQESLAVGGTFEIQASNDRLNYIERTLERLKNERLKQAEVECTALLNQARQEAMAIQEAAQQQATAIVADGEARRDEILQQGYNEGEQLGFEKGYSDAQAQIADQCLQLLDHAKTILNAAFQAQDKMLRRFTPTMAALVLYVVRQILHDALTTPEKINSLLTHAITQLGLKGRLKIVAHQSVIQTLLDFKPETHDALNSLPHVTFESDPSLHTHDIYVFSEDAHYQVSPQTQAMQYLEAITAALPDYVSDTEFQNVLATELPSDFPSAETLMMQPAPAWTDHHSDSEIEEPDAEFPRNDSTFADSNLVGDDAPGGDEGMAPEDELL